MKWRTESADERLDRLAHPPAIPGPWESWFAWYPVQLGEYKPEHGVAYFSGSHTVWLVWTQRRTVGWGGEFATSRICEHRLPLSDAADSASKTKGE